MLQAQATTLAHKKKFFWLVDITTKLRILSLSLFLPIKFPLSLQYFSQYIDTLLPNRSKLLFLTAFIAQEGKVFFFGGRERV